MTIASDAMVEACWPEDIPRDYNELFEKYGAFVASAVRRHNKVGRNFEEMFCHVRMRLIEKDVINLFMESVREKLPRQMNTAQAARFLGVSVHQWVVKMSHWHTGRLIYGKARPGEKARAIGRRQGAWMPTPINADELRVLGIQENEQKNARRVAQGLPPKEYAVTCGYARANALYDIEDLTNLASMEIQHADGTCEGPFRRQMPAENVQLKATKAHFQAYLSKSIYSDFANWCRTYKRKWAQDRPRFERDSDEPEAESWEDKLRDHSDPQGIRQETRAALKECIQVLSETLHQSMKGPDTLKCKPVEQTEIQMFDLLEQGVPLPETLRKLDVPERVRRNILKSVAEIRRVA